MHESRPCLDRSGVRWSLRHGGDHCRELLCRLIHTWIALVHRHRRKYIKKISDRHGLLNEILRPDPHSLNSRRDAGPARHKNNGWRVRQCTKYSQDSQAIDIWQHQIKKHEPKPALGRQLYRLTTPFGQHVWPPDSVEAGGDNRQKRHVVVHNEDRQQCGQ